VSSPALSDDTDFTLLMGNSATHGMVNPQADQAHTGKNFEKKNFVKHGLLVDWAQNECFVVKVVLKNEASPALHALTRLR